MRRSARYRYVWPSELELMGRVARLRLAQRWAGWKNEPFTADGTHQVAVFEKPVQSPGRGLALTGVLDLRRPIGAEGHR